MHTTKKLKCPQCKRVVNCDVTTYTRDELETEIYFFGVAHTNYSFHCGHYRNVRRRL